MTTQNLKTRVDVGNFANAINGSNIYITHYSTTSITENEYGIMLLSVLH